jgi:lambda family phage tail tape measure protein
MMQPEGFGVGFNLMANQFQTTGERMTALGQDVASAMGNAFQVQFFDPMEGRFRRLNEIVRDFAANFLQALSQIAASQLAMSLLKGLGGIFGGAKSVSSIGINPLDTLWTPIAAQGAVISSGHELTQFARGGITSGPEIFPMANGGMGLRGEAGPEAIMRLKRGPDGNLGVSSYGGGGGGNTYVYSPTIQALDASGVKQTLDADYRRWRSHHERASRDGGFRQSTALMGRSR